MKEAWLGSKYLVVPGKMLQTVICSLSGLSFSRHGSITPWPLSVSPRCLPYHSFISGWLGDLKKMPPMPRMRPFWLMVVSFLVIVRRCRGHGGVEMCRHECRHGKHECLRHVGVNGRRLPCANWG